jgi:hypothetical protein
MDIEKSFKYICMQIEILEKQVFYFEIVALPRFQQDKKILFDLKNQAVKIDAIRQKYKNGEVISSEEIIDAVPMQFR